MKKRQRKGEKDGKWKCELNFKEGICEKDWEWVLGGVERYLLVC